MKRIFVILFVLALVGCGSQESSDSNDNAQITQLETSLNQLVLFKNYRVKLGHQGEVTLTKDKGKGFILDNEEASSIISDYKDLVIDRGDKNINAVMFTCTKMQEDGNYYQFKMFCINPEKFISYYKEYVGLMKNKSL